MRVPLGEVLGGAPEGVGEAFKAPVQSGDEQLAPVREEPEQRVRKIADRDQAVVREQGGALRRDARLSHSERREREAWNGREQRSRCRRRRCGPQPPRGDEERGEPVVDDQELVETDKAAYANRVRDLSVYHEPRPDNEPQAPPPTLMPHPTTAGSQVSVAA